MKKLTVFAAVKKRKRKKKKKIQARSPAHLLVAEGSRYPESEEENQPLEKDRIKFLLLDKRYYKSCLPPHSLELTFDPSRLPAPFTYAGSHFRLKRTLVG